MKIGFNCQLIFTLTVMPSPRFGHKKDMKINLSQRREG
jgi:hypothetical protein